MIYVEAHWFEHFLTNAYPMKPRVTNKLVNIGTDIGCQDNRKRDSDVSA